MTVATGGMVANGDVSVYGRGVYTGNGIFTMIIQ